MNVQIIYKMYGHSYVYNDEEFFTNYTPPQIMNVCKMYKKRVRSVFKRKTKIFVKNIFCIYVPTLHSHIGTVP